MVTWAKRVGDWAILKIIFSIIGCDGHVVRYGFVGQVDSQSVLMTVNLFVCAHFINCTHQSLT